MGRRIYWAVCLRTFVTLGASFLLGMILGWKIHGWRVKYLARKRDRYARKALETQQLIDS